MKRVAFLGLAVCLLASGCGDSQNPLSDPNISKPDNRLAGIWLWRGENGEVVYFHVGQAGDNFPGGMMRIVSTKHDQGKVEPPEQYLAFPTVLNGKTYLNVVADQKQVRQLDETGWKPEFVETYVFLKVQVDGDKLVAWLTDADAKKRVIKSGEVKGVIEPQKPPIFTDTTENVARFVSKAGDSLFSMKEPVRFERVRQLGSALLFPEEVERAMMGDAHKSRIKNEELIPPNPADKILPVPRKRPQSP